MNITEFMSFDLEWFTTLPGLLITGGVIVLLIALIIFIVSNKKADKKLEEESSNNAVTTNTDMNSGLNTEMPVSDSASIESPSIDNNVSTMPINTEPVPVDFNVPENNVYTSNGSVNILGSMPSSEPASIPTPVVNTNDSYAIPTVVEPTQPVVNDFNTNNTNNINNPAVDNNVVDFTTVTQNVPVEPVVTETTPVETTPVVSEPVVVAPGETNVVEPIVQPEIVQQPEVKPTIYGGVNPINTVAASTVSNDAKPVIYGGANPLENTTTIPRITNHEVYNVGVNTTNEPVTPITQVEPVQPQITEVPVQEPVQPQVVPVVPAEPVIVKPVTQPEPVMPMTGEVMFGATDTSESNSSNDSSNEIETLEF